MLEAARMELRTERELVKESFTFVSVRLKFSSMLHCACVAILVLLMELCLNRKPQMTERADSGFTNHSAS